MAVSREDFIKMARPLAQGLIDYAMTAGKSYGITDVRVGVGAREKQTYSVERGDVTSVLSGESFGVDVTLFAGDRVLSFSKNTDDADLLRSAVDTNIQVVGLVPENPDMRLLEKKWLHQGPVPDLDLYDENPPGEKELIAYAKAMEAAAQAQPKVKTVEATQITMNAVHSFALATNGQDDLSSETFYQAFTVAVAEDESGMQTADDSSVAIHFSDMRDPLEIGERAGRKAAGRLGAVSLPTGKMPVILSRDAAEDFFALVFKAINGTAVHQGKTFLKDKIGQRVMSKGVTIEDDPLVPRGLSSNPVDRTGQAARKVTFVQDGVLQLFNVRLDEARQLGVDPIGRSDGRTNVRVLPGRKTPDALMRDIKDGLYVEEFSGGSADVNDGTLSYPAQGFLIKNGKITDIAVDGVVVAGNLKRLFRQVSLANDTPILPSTRYFLAAPTTRINGLKIVGQ